MIRFLLRLSLPLSLSLSLPLSVLACPYCFNDLDSPQTRSAAAGVLVMIGFVVFVLGTIGTLAFKWAKRARELERLSVK